MLMQLLEGHLPAGGWELGQMAQALGLPRPPEAKLPALTGGGCDFNQLAEALGPAAADALSTALGRPDLGALLTGHLTGLKDQLLTYAGMVDGEVGRVRDELMDRTGTLGALGQEQEQLSSLRAALGQPTSSPLGGPLLNAVTGACPAAGYALSLTEQALAAGESELSAVEGMLSAAQARLASLQEARTLTDTLLAQVDAQLAALPGALAQFRGTP